MKVKIKCPNCNSIEQGKIEQSEGMPYFDYYGYCKKCDYHITESEFEEIEDGK